MGLLVLPALAWAAPDEVGVVTTLSGHATLTRLSAPAPATLAFRDPIFARDTIRTSERSHVRVLLQGKALVTVRELSVFSISEQRASVAVELHSGTVGLGVAPKRMAPGDTVELRTPNAVAAVRGTFIVVETVRASAQAGPDSAGAATRVHVLSGAADVAPRSAPGAWVRVEAPGTVTVSGDTVSTPVALDSATMGRLTADFSTPQPQHTAVPDGVMAQEQGKALALALLLAGDQNGDEPVQALEVNEPPQGGSGTASDGKAPLVPPIPPAAPGPTLPFIFNNQTVNIAGSLYQVPAASTQTLSTDLLRATSSTVTIANDVLEVAGILNSTVTAPFMTSTSSALSARNLTLLQGGRLTLAGPLFSGSGGALTTADDMVKILGGGQLTGAGTGALLALSGTALNVGNGAGDALFGLSGAGSSATLGGALLTASGSGITLTGSGLLDVSGSGALTGLGAGSLVDLSTGTLTLNSGAHGFLFGAGGTGNLAGGLLSTNATNVAASGDLVNIAGTLTGTGPGALLSLSAGTVSARNLGLISGAGRLTLAGSLLDRTGGTLTTIDDVLNVSGGGRLTAAGSGALLHFSGGTLNVGNGAGDQLFQLTGAGSTASLGGALLDAANTTISLTGSSFVEVSSGAALTASGAGRLVTLAGGSLTLNSGATGFRFSSATPSTLAGGLLGATNTNINSTLAAPGDLLSVTGTLMSTTTNPFISLNGGTVKARNFGIVSSAAGRLTLAGAFLDRSGVGTLTTTDDLLNVSGGGRLTSTGTGALLGFSGATVTVGNGAGGDQFFVVTGAGSSAVLAGPALSAAASTLRLIGSAVFEVSASGTVTDTSTLPLMSLTGGSLQLNAGANGFLVNTAGRANLRGGLLSTTNTNITASGDFVRGLGGGRFIVTGSTAPLISLTGGTHLIGTGGSIFRLSGTATALDPVSGLVLGTEQPIQHGGAFLETTGATVTSLRGVRLDAALVQASAPLLSLRANGATQSVLTTNSNAVDLTFRAKLTDSAPVIALDKSRLTVNNASVLNAAGGSYLGTSTDAIRVANGSRLTVNNGGLLFASGGAKVDISGALVAFGGTGNTVSIANTLCGGGCASIGGIRVALTGGALAANVSITNPIKNLAGNTVTVGPTAAYLRVDGAATRVTIRGL